MIAPIACRTGYVEWIAFAVFGLALVLLAAPRLAAEYLRLGAAPAVRAMTENRGRISEAVITDAAEKLTDAAFFTPRNPALFNNLAMIELASYELFKSKGESDTAFTALSRAQSSLQRALIAAPGDANIWYLLAESRVRLNGADKKAFDYLRLSYLTGPREGWIVRHRLGLSLRLWPIMPDEIKKMTRREIRTLWTVAAYRRDLVWHYLRAMETVREIILAEVSHNAEGDKTILLNLAKRMGKSR